MLDHLLVYVFCAKGYQIAKVFASQEDPSFTIILFWHNRKKEKSIYQEQDRREEDREKPVLAVQQIF